MMSNDGRAVSTKPPICVEGATNAGRGGVIDTALPDGERGGVIDTALPDGERGGVIDTALPIRKRLDHRGPLSIDVSGAWYFITICAEKRVDYGRAVSMKPPQTPFMLHVSDILGAARFRQIRGLWKLALFLVMPDHIHLIAHFPGDAAVSSTPPYRMGNAAASSTPPYRGMEYVIADLKRWLSTKYGIRFQRDFWDTRLRDDAHYAEKFRYICNNPVRKGLCTIAREWPHVIAFDRVTGAELQHRGGVGGGVIDTALPGGCGKNDVEKLVKERK